ncbi:hypothetical protein D3C74_233770 [compost metagenome]
MLNDTSFLYHPYNDFITIHYSRMPEKKKDGRQTRVLFLDCRPYRYRVASSASFAPAQLLVSKLPFRHSPAFDGFAFKQLRFMGDHDQRGPLPQRLAA